VSVVLGVDGGGTKTHAVITDETGRILGEGLGGPTNIDDHDLETATVHLETAVNQARAHAQLKTEPFDAAFLGIAGVVSAADHALVRKFARRLELTRPNPTGPDPLGVDHDARVALAGGLSGRPGMVLIAGTGSACFGMNAAGERHLAGGWGHLLADEGSGYWLGLEALRAAVRGFDGRGQPTLLEHRVLDFLGVHAPEEMMHRLYVIGLSRAELAAFGPTTLEVAASGDGVARAIVRRGATALVDTVEATAGRLNLVASEVVLVGGVLRSELMLELLRKQLAMRLPQTSLVEAEHSPAYGACLLAQTLLPI